MNRNRLKPIMSALVPVLLILAAGCSSQKNDNLDTAEQAPPPPAPSNESEMAGTTAPEPPPPQERKSTATSHPQRTRTSQPTSPIPEERPRAAAPPQPAPVVVTIPAGSTLAVNLPEPLSSGTAVVGNKVTATLKSPLLVGARVGSPAC